MLTAETCREPLSPAQSAVFGFIRMHHRQTDSMPTLVEMAQNFGWSSPNAAQEHIRMLVRKGYLTTVPGKARGIRFATGLSPYDEIRELMRDTTF